MAKKKEEKEEEERCRDCNALLSEDAGEGYDGRCGACADKAEGKGTIRHWFESLDDPDNVGASEYRALHELISDIVDNDDAGDNENDFDHMDVVLSEVTRWAYDLRRSLKKYVRSNKQRKSRVGRRGR